MARFFATATGAGYFSFRGFQSSAGRARRGHVEAGRWERNLADAPSRAHEGPAKLDVLFELGFKEIQWQWPECGVWGELRRESCRECKKIPVWALQRPGGAGALGGFPWALT
eukprot:3169165-Pyramimonas_sp.AAC.1